MERRILGHSEVQTWALTFDGDKVTVKVLRDKESKELTVEVLRAALEWTATGSRGPGQAGVAGPILGCEPNERALRFGLERGYRALAKLTSDHQRKIELVDLANTVRPRTWT